MFYFIFGGPSVVKGKGKLNFAVFVMNGHQGWFMRNVVAPSSSGAIRASGLRVAAGYTVEAHEKGSAEAKAAYRKVSTRMPAGILLT